MATHFLSEKDVERLLRNPSPVTRAATAVKVAREFDSGSLNEKQRAEAEAVFRLLAEDAEVRVREALSTQLKTCKNLPHDLAMRLASDVSTVAVPLLNFSEVLTDDDLVDIIAAGDEDKQVAIARRKQISDTVSEALIDTKRPAVVTKLVVNTGADIPDGSLEKVIDTLGDSESMQMALVHRPGLPIGITEKLLTVLSERFQAELVKQQNLPTDLATDLILKTRERAVVALSGDSGIEDVQALVQQLHDNGRLTPSIILRALFVGDFRFFEAALAVRAAIPMANAQVLVSDPGKAGLARLWAVAAMPDEQLPSARAAIQAATEIDYDGGPGDLERYSRRLIELVLTQCDDPAVNFTREDLDYLIAKMDALPANFVAEI